MLRVARINDAGEIILEEYERLITDRTRLVALSHISNALGTINPLRKMIKMAHSVKAVVLVDGAQAVPHMRIDVQDLDCDFMYFQVTKCMANGRGCFIWKISIIRSDGLLSRRWK